MGVQAYVPGKRRGGGPSQRKEEVLIASFFRRYDTCSPARGRVTSVDILYVSDPDHSF